MHSKDMLSIKKHDTMSWDHHVQLQGSLYDIQGCTSILLVETTKPKQ